MSLLFYWKWENYSSDRKRGFEPHFNQNNEIMLEVRPGDTIWAFTRRKWDSKYALAAKAAIERCEDRGPKSDYGRYRVWLYPDTIEYFDVDQGADIESLIRAFSIPTNAEELYHSFQGKNAVRVIDAEDERKLEEFAERRQLLKLMAVQPQYIEIRANRAGQERPFLSGTRVRVQDVVIYHERFGQTAEEIAQGLPLSIAQVHAALAYYFEDRMAIWACIREDEQAAEELRVTVERPQDGSVSDASSSAVSS